MDPSQVAGSRVLEVGALNVNGTVRPVVELMRPAAYVALDAQPGRGVDVVDRAENLIGRFGPHSFDVVICAEMLEHAQDWRACLIEMAGVLADRGRLVLTTRSPGFPYHPHPVDCWRFTCDLLEAAARRLDMVHVDAQPDPDTPGVFLTGIRAGSMPLPAGILDDLDALPVEAP